jgi:F0F1-type ATP synthase delta subunit
LLRNPGVPREKRLALINELGLSDMTKSTIETLVDNRREKKINQICDRYESCNGSKSR